MIPNGTHVYIKPLFKADRPRHENCNDTERKRDSIEQYKGYIKEHYQNGYYIVDSRRGATNDLYIIHEDEMVNLETHKNKYKIGDKVEIMPLNEHEKALYPPRWISDMDEHVGDIVTIETIMESPDHYGVKENCWTWHASNLEPDITYTGY